MSNLTEFLAEEMPVFDFGEKITRIITAFNLYQSSVLPSEKNIFDVLEKQQNVKQGTVEALRLLTNTLSELFNEEEAATSRHKEVAIDKEKFKQEMASALTILNPKNISTPAIMSHLFEHMPDEDLEEIMSSLGKPTKDRIKKYL